MTTLRRRASLEVTGPKVFVAEDTPRSHRGINCTRLHDALWRVTRGSGEVMGYLERFEEPRGTRYRAKRFLARQRGFVIAGEFWSIDDALDALRFS